MKFSGSFSSLLVVVLPLLLQAAALPNGNRFGGGFGGGFGKGQQGSNQANKGNGANNAAGQNSSNNANAGNSASNANNANNANAGNNANNNANNNNNDNDLQTSLTLDPSVIGSNLAQNGLNGTGSEAGQAPSLTSTNNFINFCAGKTITNGLQVQDGSCNPVPMGDIPAKTAQPACKFTFPTNGANIQPNTNFTVTMSIQNLDTGFFVNPNTNYFAAPQQLSNGVIQGHSHIVIQAINGLDDTKVVDPTSFAYFKGLNEAAEGGVLSAVVAGGLAEGTYKVSSINTAANHQPVLVPVAQHGSLDDAVYFTVGGSGGQDVFGNGGGAAAGAAAGAGGANNANAGGANNANAGGAAAAGGNNSTASAANNGGKNTGAANNGGKNAGAANNGAKNTGAANAGAKNTGAANAGAKNTGAANAGAKNTGAANNGAKNAGAAKNPFAGGAQRGQQQQQQGKGRRSFTISRQN